MYRDLSASCVVAIISATIVSFHSRVVESVSRDVDSILKEVKDLHDKGFKEVTLLGQNVNSYGLLPNGKRPENGTSFAELLRKVAQSVPDMRVRFTTSKPRRY